jgi:hypothetical protein
MATRKRGRPRAARGFETVKWTPRVRPTDLEAFHTVRDELATARGVRVSDAEVFRLAVAALVSSRPDARQQLPRARG